MSVTETEINNVLVAGNITTSWPLILGVLTMKLGGNVTVTKADIIALLASRGLLNESDEDGLHLQVVMTAEEEAQIEKDKDVHLGGSIKVTGCREH